MYDFDLASKVAGAGIEGIDRAAIKMSAGILDFNIKAFKICEFDGKLSFAEPTQIHGQSNYSSHRNLGSLYGLARIFESGYQLIRHDDPYLSNNFSVFERGDHYKFEIMSRRGDLVTVYFDYGRITELCRPEIFGHFVFNEAAEKIISLNLARGGDC